AEAYAGDEVVRPPQVEALRRAAARGDDGLRKLAERLGVRAMPLRDQMAFQLRFVDEALRLAAEKILFLS
ncbi:MAG: hypothetical protein AAGN46_13075, partial [Acidobacteriota bacterium]